MGKHYLVRVWELKAGCAGEELEELMSSGYLEMQQWMPGVEHVSLLRAGGAGEGRYVLMTTFVSPEAYRYWRQVEEEAADYWERYEAELWCVTDCACASAGQCNNTSRGTLSVWLVAGRTSGAFADRT